MHRRPMFNVIDLNGKSKLVLLHCPDLHSILGRKVLVQKSKQFGLVVQLP